MNFSPVIYHYKRKLQTSTFMIGVVIIRKIIFDISGLSQRLSIWFSWKMVINYMKTFSFYFQNWKILCISRVMAIIYYIDIFNFCTKNVDVSKIIRTKELVYFLKSKFLAYPYPSRWATSTNDTPAPSLPTPTRTYTNPRKDDRNRVKRFVTHIKPLSIKQPSRKEPNKRITKM